MSSTFRTSGSGGSASATAPSLPGSVSLISKLGENGFVSRYFGQVLAALVLHRLLEPGERLVASST